ncbi:hypothetical protein AU210_016684 [Fusarium oxysporum f. sp. radicis-cucumerinum]|uniref:Myb-like domain-containing protein n=2 Tax=Fusarium oxysporum TaxID=5507 RepID=A0A2H3G835_FUSOX|nr:hypothetical protein AU210_016684 [Fusarium oxysporum f. sp. radicis-cucumerinum]RKK15050.1 hypothetical protein BFJ65_g11594 [Fusarium oxysporum f. sp. cepae]RKK27406.1 hypothetical protein BFJ67_g16148 [Fusarium oxysporum f. sp. cepae]RKK27630.1 hypothetical protein BFJ66_g16563 [Fusarium oxysporum f. sp. cepae]
MISTTSGAEQQTLLQSFTPPDSRAVAVSLSNKEAVLSADGKSKGDAIWISSDDDSDTEDEGDDKGQDLVDSQSCTTPTTSIADHLDSTSTKHSPTESEAAIGVDTTPAVSLALGEDDQYWTYNSHMGPLADSEPNQQSPYQTNRTSAGDAAACTDASFNVSPPSPGSQPHRSVSDEEQLVTGATSEPDIMMVDSLSDECSSDDAQSTPTSPLMHTYSHIAAGPGDVGHTPLHDSEECASTSPDDAISRAHTPSPAKSLSPESQQEQDYNHVSCESSDAGSESSEAEPGSPFGARLSPLSPPSQELSPRRRSRRRSSHAHETVQDKDRDIDTEGSGSEDDLDIPECARDEDYCPSPNQGHGSGDDSDDGQHCHKRRKAPGSPYSSVRSTPTSARDPRRRKRSTRAIAHSLRERDTSALGLFSRPSSHARSVPLDASAFLAQFQEWQLKDVSMKRIIENGQTTFQFQFEWPLCANHPQAASVSPDSTRSVAAKKTTKRALVRGAKYSEDEDNFLIQLKEEEQLGWVEIRRRFAQRFPERGGSGLQVHYCTKLKDRRRA